LRRLVAALAVAVGLTVMNVPSATAGRPQARRDDYPGRRASLGGLRVDRSTVVAGRSIAISTRSCTDGTAGASLDGARLRLAAPDRRGGVLRARATIPGGTPAGTHQLLARCDGTVAGAATVQVVAADVARGGSSLPERRSNIVPGVSLGLALIVTGALPLTGISRRRRSTTQS
jgi:hypothetical protein